MKRTYTDLNAMHLCLVAVMFWLSFVFWLPNDITAQPGFSGFRQFDTEDHWVWWLFFAGLAGVTGLLTHNGIVKNTSIFILATVHLSVAYCFLLDDIVLEIMYPPPGIYFLLALMGYYVFWRRIF